MSGVARVIPGLLLAIGCGGFEVAPPDAQGAAGSGNHDLPTRAICAAEDDDPLPGTHPVGLRVEGNGLVDESGQPIFLRGVNRSGSEYRCVQGGGFFDGPCDEASVRAMKTWNINAVRVPLNESCWLGIGNVAPELAGDNYRRAIESYVYLLHKYDLIPILELHWTRSGDRAADGLEPMPNADHSPRLWREVAQAFIDDTGVIFEPFNEPFPDRNRDTPEAWQCWRDGCTEQTRGADPEPYAAVGMQELVGAIRETGARQPILLGGVTYSNSLTGWLEHQPQDPIGNLAAAWHVYNFNACRSEACWSAAPLEVAAQVPVVATEIGQNDCGSDFIAPLMAFLDQHASGYLAWSWNVQGACQPAMGQAHGNPWPLINSFETASPNSAYAEAFRDHVLGMTR